jgi:hypothetical protein
MKKVILLLCSFWLFNQTTILAQSCITITQPAALTSGIVGTNVSCKSGSNGAANLTAAGGTTPYAYLWSNGATTEDLTNIVAGTYNVTVTDANLCTSVANVTITEPTQLTANLTKTNVSCNGGSNGAVDLTAGGGTTAYSFLWSNGATTEDLSNVTAGAYTVTVTDANLCTVSASIAVTQPFALASAIVGTDVLCNGNATGAANLTVTNGTAPYTFIWSNGATTEDLTNIVAGTYNVTITDNNSCTKTDNVTIAQPTVLTAGLTKTNVSCNGGSNGTVNLTAAGGTTAYTFLWSNGATTEDLSGVVAGAYTVTVTDAHLCTVSASITVTQPLALTSAIAGTNVLCNGYLTGVADLTVTEGTAPYTFIWSNGATTEDLTNIAAGTYNVTVTDANGCTKTDNVTITQPTALSFTTTQANVKCFGESNGSVTITGNGGATPYSYSLDDAATFPNTTGTFNSLSAGTYKPAVKDANGCITKCQ